MQRICHNCYWAKSVHNIKKKPKLEEENLRDSVERAIVYLL